MSEYADGFDDGKGEKFDELMEEIVTLREQLKDCSAAFDKQQEQLDRNAEQNAALRKNVEKYRWFFLELDKEIATLRDNLIWTLHELKTAADRLTELGHTTVSARDCIGQVEAALKEKENEVSH